MRPALAACFASAWMKDWREEDRARHGRGAGRQGNRLVRLGFPWGPFAFDKTQCTVILRSHWRGETNGFVILTVRFKGMRINNRQILQALLSNLSFSVELSSQVCHRR